MKLKETVFYIQYPEITETKCKIAELKGSDTVL